VAERNLRDYKLLTQDEMRMLDARRAQLQKRCEKLSARLLAANRGAERQQRRLLAERGLLNMALHELAVERAQKDPARFIQLWLIEHEPRMEAW